MCTVPFQDIFQINYFTSTVCNQFERTVQVQREDQIHPRLFHHAVLCRFGNAGPMFVFCSFLCFRIIPASISVLSSDVIHVKCSLAHLNLSGRAFLPAPYMSEVSKSLWVSTTKSLHCCHSHAQVTKSVFSAAQIPVPSLKPILTALLISTFVLIFRWLGN